MIWIGLEEIFRLIAEIRFCRRQDLPEHIPGQSAVQRHGPDRFAFVVGDKFLVVIKRREFRQHRARVRGETVSLVSRGQRLDGPRVKIRSRKIQRGNGTQVHQLPRRGECADLPQGCSIESDKVNPDKFYAFRDGSFYMSEDAGKGFKKIADFLVPSVTFEAAPNEEGRLYVAVGGGGVYTMDAAEGKLERVAGDVQNCKAVGIGAPEKEGDPDTLFIIGEANNEGAGVYISQDRGATWKRINTDSQQWGNVNPKIAGDPKVFGRCYISTNGRGIIRGDVKT